MSLANKYRPQSFDQMCSQSHVVEIVRRMCQSDTLSNRNFLFTGPAGTGKTSLGRLIAKSLNGSTDNLIEIDAASHSGVDDMRELVQQASQYPVGTKYKIFLIDECFPGNAEIITPNGNIQIKDVRIGDAVYNMQGQSIVTNVFENHVPTEDLVVIKLDDNYIITTKNHLFFTDSGWVPAIDLHQGDYLYDFKELRSMWKIFSDQGEQQSEDFMWSRMSQDMDAQQDVRQTFERISEKVSDMWQRLLYSKKCECENVFSQVWLYLAEVESQYGKIVGTTFKTLAYIYLSCLWNSEGNYEQSSSEVLQQRLCDNMETTTSCSQESCDKALRMVQEFIYSTLWSSQTKDMLAKLPYSINCLQAEREIKTKIFRMDYCTQSDVKSRKHSKDDSYQGAQWDTSSAICLSWWQWSIHNSSTDFAERFGGNVEIRIRSKNSNFKEQQSESLSYELQTRPSLSGEIDMHRGGWCNPFIEIPTVVRREKDSISTKSRVDSVEVYQPGHNDELFNGSFSSDELSEEFVTMYDLEISGHPSYFVNGILVHNCHSLSSSSWQALLKCLEEQLAMTVFIMATTNPEKIPETILSRVQSFKLSKLSSDQIYDRLKYVIECENKEGRNITYTEDALRYLSNYAGGGLRDALTNLDKVLAFGNNITTELLETALDLPNYDDYFELLNGIVKRDNTLITTIIDRVYNSGLNFVKWFEGYHSFLCNIVKYIFLRDISKTTIPSHYLSKIEKYTAQHAALCLKLSNKVLQMNKDIRNTQYLQEVALSYLLVPEAPKKTQGGNA